MFPFPNISELNLHSKEITGSVGPQLLCHTEHELNTIPTDSGRAENLSNHKPSDKKREKMGKKTGKRNEDGGEVEKNKGKQRKQPQSVEDVMSMAKQWSTDAKEEEKRKEKAKGQKLLLERGVVKQ